MNQASFNREGHSNQQQNSSKYHNDVDDDGDDDNDILISEQHNIDTSPGGGSSVWTFKRRLLSDFLKNVDKRNNFRFCLSFFLFGLLNNVLYVIILSSALDLVPSDVPTGVILMANITPSLLIKLSWPYISRGTIRYSRRMLFCSNLSFFGMIVIVSFDSVLIRLIGIGLGSLSSGLGEMTFLQLSSKYHQAKDQNNQGESDDLPSTSITWFSSGTGAAGVFGAGFWWLLKSLGVRKGLGISSILPICLSLTYFFILPTPEEILSTDLDENHRYRATVPEDNLSSEDSIKSTGIDKQRLGFSDKFRLMRPLLVPFMAPLFFVYFAEYTINTGIAPVLLYPIPKPESNPVFSKIFKTLRDYYPFWQLTYQTFVFFARSSIAIFKFPALPKGWIPIPSLIQMLIFLSLYLESSHQVILNLLKKILNDSGRGETTIYGVVFGLICLEGICGGLSYVSVYYWLSRFEETDRDNSQQPRPIDSIHFDILSHQEFRIACVGFSDTFGILIASLFSSWLQPKICQDQLNNNIQLCKQL
ncbi:CLN3 protein-domain-containing protein [Phakopsora pachyrhizi]|nr:CLN3 protein-domain-containing protein [Phakopsora pachyrhizi]